MTWKISPADIDILRFIFPPFPIRIITLFGFSLIYREPKGRGLEYKKNLPKGSHKSFQIKKVVIQIFFIIEKQFPVLRLRTGVSTNESVMIFSNGKNPVKERIFF
jgi:hypothetical protein